MEIVKTIAEMQSISTKHRKRMETIACVPTMGYLHEGHISLLKKAKEIADIVIVTLFVNPTQFAPNEDFERYPRDFEHDRTACEENGCDYLFYPDTTEMYPNGFNTTIKIRTVTEKFEGVHRPGHFDGVATVVAKLFNATLPDFAIFGQKDYQQTLVIRKLVSDLNFPVEIIVSPTIREVDGLAKSSRNVYLDPEERQKATIIYKSINKTKDAINKGERNRYKLNELLRSSLLQVPEVKIDYAEVVEAETLSELQEFEPNMKVVILVALHLGKTRLIDNEVITIPKID